MIDTLWDEQLGVREYKLIWREGVKGSLPPSKSVDREAVKAPLPPSRLVEKMSTGSSHHTTSRQVDRPQPPAGPSRSAPSQPSSIPSRPTSKPASQVVEPILRPATPPSPIIAKAEAPPAPAQGLNIRSKASSSDIKPSFSDPSAPDVTPSQASTSTLNIRARATTSLPTTRETPIVPAPSAIPKGLSIRSASTPTQTPTPKPVPSLLSRLNPSTSTPSLMPASTSTPTITNKRARAEDFAPNAPSHEEPQRRSLAERLAGPEKKQRVSSNPETGSAPSLLSRMSQQGQVSMPSSPNLPTQPNNQFTIKRTAQPQPVPSSSGISIKQPTQTSSGLSIKRSGLLPTPAQSPGLGGFSIKNRSTSSTSTPAVQSPIQHEFKSKRSEIEVQPKVEVHVEDDTPLVRKGRGFAASNFGGVELLITPPNPPKLSSNGGRLQDRLGFQKK